MPFVYTFLFWHLFIILVYLSSLESLYVCWSNSVFCNSHGYLCCLDFSCFHHPCSQPMAFCEVAILFMTFMPWFTNPFCIWVQYGLWSWLFNLITGPWVTCETVHIYADFGLSPSFLSWVSDRHGTDRSRLESMKCIYVWREMCISILVYFVFTSKIRNNWTMWQTEQTDSRLGALHSWDITEGAADNNDCRHADCTWNQRSVLVELTGNANDIRL